jgi:ECF sigma factor
MPDVTQILPRIESGDSSAAEHLLPLVYTELRKLAAQRIAHEPSSLAFLAIAIAGLALLRTRPRRCIKDR